MPRPSTAPVADTPAPIVYTIIETVSAERALKAMTLRNIDINSWRILTAYRELQDRDGSCRLEVSYRKSDCGRLVVSQGIQLLSSRVRSVLLSGSEWVDMDIENCHPGLLLQLAKEHRLDCQILQQYCDNPKASRLANPSLKRDVLVAINNPSATRTQPLLSQCSNIVKMLYCEDKYRHLAPTDGENIVGRFISRLLCQMECDLLVKIYESFKASDVLALIHDGLIVRQSAANVSKMSEINRMIAPLRLIPKPWAEVTEGLDMYILQQFDYDSTVYFNDMTKFSDRQFSSEVHMTHTLQPYMLECVRMIGARDAILKESDKKFSILSASKTDGPTFRVTGAKGRPTAVPFKRLLSIFSPLISFTNYTLYRSSRPTEFSLFCGFAAHGTLPPGAMAVIDPILKHIREVWASDSEEMYNYIIKWLAFVVQKFPQKTGKNIILNGDEGTGKSMVMEWLKESVFGDSLCYTTSGSEMLTRGFNSHLAGKLIVCLEELKGDTDTSWKHAIDVIKHLTTSKTINMERKGVDVKEDINAMNIIAFTNYEHALPNVTGMNRRLVLNRVSDKYKGNAAYFQRLHAATQHQWSGLAMLEYLRSVDTSYDDLEKIPQTTKKVEMRWHYLSWIDRVAYLMIAQDTVATSHEFDTRNVMDIISQYSLYVGNTKSTPISIGMMLSKRFNKRRTTNNVTKFSFQASEFSDSAMLQSAIEHAKSLTEYDCSVD